MAMVPAAAANEIEDGFAELLGRPPGKVVPPVNPPRSQIGGSAGEAIGMPAAKAPAAQGL